MRPPSPLLPTALSLRRRHLLPPRLSAASPRPPLPISPSSSPLSHHHLTAAALCPTAKISILRSQTLSRNPSCAVAFLLASLAPQPPPPPPPPPRPELHSLPKEGTQKHFRSLIVRQSCRPITLCQCRSILREFCEKYAKPEDAGITNHPHCGLWVVRVYALHPDDFSWFSGGMNEVEKDWFSDAGCGDIWLECGTLPCYHAFISALLGETEP